MIEGQGLKLNLGCGSRHLQDIRYWDWPLEKLRRNAAFFDLKLTELQTAEALYAAIVD